MSKMKLFEYAVLFHPKATKEQKDAGEEPVSRILMDSITMLARDQNEAVMRVARELPSEYMTKLDQVEIMIRSF